MIKLAFWVLIYSILFSVFEYINAVNMTSGSWWRIINYGLRPHVLIFFCLSPILVWGINKQIYESVGSKFWFTGIVMSLAEFCGYLFGAILFYRKHPSLRECIGFCLIIVALLVAYQPSENRKLETTDDLIENIGGDRIMQMISNPDTNSHVKAYGYDPMTKVMRIEFVGNNVYDYPNAEQEDFDDLVKAESKGSHIHRVIKSKFLKPIKMTKHETTEGRVGHLVVNEEIVSNNPIKGALVGYCPACGKEAEGWEPPVQDSRYLERRKYDRERYNLTSDEEADKQFLKDNGYIEICSECSTSFFVNGSKAHLRAKDEG